MYSHFSVILLCFTGVYCISSMIEDLDLNDLRQILNDQGHMEEWDTAMDQDIYYEGTGGLKTNVNVKQAVEDFVQKADNSDKTGFERIRNIIEIAYQCTLAKYANLTAYLIVQDVRALKANITMALILMRKKGILYDRENILTDTTFLSYFKEVSKKQLNHFDLDLIFRERNIVLNGEHDFVSSPSKEWHNVLADMINKDLDFKIKYKIYPDVFGKKFTNELDLPDVHVLNEIVCVLNEVIQLFDNFIVDKCVQHNGSFLNNFCSLEKGVNNDLIRLTNNIDKKIADGSSYWALYKDFSIPGPGTSQANNEVMGSGGFVENVEFEISDLKMDLPNDKNLTEMYGHQDNERTSEIVLEILESCSHHENGINVCAVLIRDNENWLADQLSSIIISVIDE